jgi:hypothetical protein
MLLAKGHHFLKPSTASECSLAKMTLANLVGQTRENTH